MEQLELDLEKQEEVKEEVVKQEEEISPIVQKALDMGWRPKEEFDGDEDEFIDAEEFIRRKPLFEKIEHQKRELKEVKKALDVFKEHFNKVRETEYSRALQALRNEHKAALEAGDADKVVEITEKIADAKAEEKVQREAAKTQVVQPHPDFIAWVNRNSWYAQNTELRSFADQVGIAYAANNPDVDPNEVLKYVEKRVKSTYKDKFTNPNRDKPSPVEGRSKVSNDSSSRKDDIELTEEEHKVMKTLVRQGVMSEKEYKDSIKSMRGV